MKTRQRFLLGLSLGLVAGSARGAPMGTAYTYQGLLVKAGTPVTDVCTFDFTLWDAASGGNQIGSTLEVNAAVTDGHFKATLDFGGGAFNGDARWLEITVQCPGDPDPVLLTPRVELTPTPYALALPGLRTEQNTGSPNVIGGFSSNFVEVGVVGATIGGGGSVIKIPFPTPAENRVTADFGTVGGGFNNASDRHATVGGGTGNTASGFVATIGGGDDNTASGWKSTVAAGVGNTASGDVSTVAGGGTNTASCTQSTVGGGGGNTACGFGATVPGGSFNEASGDYSFAVGRRAKADHDGAFV